MCKTLGSCLQRMFEPSFLVYLGATLGELGKKLIPFPLLVEVLQVYGSKKCMFLGKANLSFIYVLNYHLGLELALAKGCLLLPCCQPGNGSAGCEVRLPFSSIPELLQTPAKVILFQKGLDDLPCVVSFSVIVCCFNFKFGFGAICSSAQDSTCSGITPRGVQGTI